ncbi:MAG: MFS transporter [Clostridia bacterium]|nr:MFS transporter [Clostridia bacterium]
MTYKSTMLACEFGITTQALVNNLMPILFVIFKDSFGISYTLIANIMLLNFTIQLLTDGLSIKIIKRLGYRKTGILAQICAALGLILLGILPRIFPMYISLLLSVAFCAFGGGLLEVMVSPIVDSLDTGHSSARMSMLHSFYCWGQLAVILISTTAIKLFSNTIWQILPLCWSVVPIVNIFLFAAVPMPKTDNSSETNTSGSLLKSSLFITMCLLMLCSGAAEITMSQWASLFAQKGLGIDKFAGDLLGPCLFALLMGTGRLLYGIFGARLDLKKSLAFCSLLCTACYLTAALSENPYIALLGCSVTGFSVSIMWPGVYSYSSKMIPRGGAAMFGLLALFGDIGCSLGSWLCGTVSDFSQRLPEIVQYAADIGIIPEQLGLKLGIGLTTIFPIIMLILLVLTTKKGLRSK